MPLPRSITRPTDVPTPQPTIPHPDLHKLFGWLIGVSCLLLMVFALLGEAPTRVTVGLCLVALATLPCSLIPAPCRWAAGGLGIALC